MATIYIVYICTDSHMIYASTTKVVSLILSNGKGHSIQTYVIKYMSVSLCILVTSTNENDLQDITKILLKMALKT